MITKPAVRTAPLTMSIRAHEADAQLVVPYVTPSTVGFMDASRYVWITGYHETTWKQRVLVAIQQLLYHMDAVVRVTVLALGMKTTAITSKTPLRPIHKQHHLSTHKRRHGQSATVRPAAELVTAEKHWTQLKKKNVKRKENSSSDERSCSDSCCRRNVLYNADEADFIRSFESCHAYVRFIKQSQSAIVRIQNLPRAEAHLHCTPRTQSQIAQWTSRTYTESIPDCQRKQSSAKCNNKLLSK